MTGVDKNKLWTTWICTEWGKNSLGSLEGFLDWAHFCIFIQTLWLPQSMAALKNFVKVLWETIRFPRHIMLKTNGTLLGRMPNGLVGGKKNPGWISINKPWLFLESVSRRQKSIFTTAPSVSVPVFCFLAPGFFSVFLLSQLQCLLFAPGCWQYGGVNVCWLAREAPQTPVLAQDRDFPEDVGSSLAELCQPTTWGSCSSEWTTAGIRKWACFGRGFAVPDSIPRQGRRVQQCPSKCCVPMGAVVPARSSACSSPYITLVLGTVPTVFGCCFGAAAHHPGEVLWALLPVLPSCEGGGHRPSPGICLRSEKYLRLLGSQEIFFTARHS